MAKRREERAALPLCLAPSLTPEGPRRPMPIAASNIAGAKMVRARLLSPAHSTPPQKPTKNDAPVPPARPNPAEPAVVLGRRVTQPAMAPRMRRRMHWGTGIQGECVLGGREWGCVRCVCVNVRRERGRRAPGEVDRMNEQVTVPPRPPAPPPRPLSPFTHTLFRSGPCGRPSHALHPARALPPHTMQAALLGSSVCLGGTRLAMPARAASRAGVFCFFCSSLFVAPGAA